MPPECHHISNAGFKDERGRTDHVKAMEQVIKDDGGEVLYSHDLVKLVQDKSGAVTGAIFKVEGGYKQINAKKGVILATGGYAGNPDMLRARDPETCRCVTSLNYNTNNTGAGIKAALWAGADMDAVGATMVFDRGNVKPGVDAGMYDAGADTQFGKEAYRLSAIRKAPFYGAWYGGSLLTTIDGVRINKHCQAVDKNYQPIPGLYVVGTASGSYYAGNYPVYLVGNCLGRQVTFGRYAARHAAGDIA